MAIIIFQFKIEVNGTHRFASEASKQKRFEVETLEIVNEIFVR
jgi:hypothetical protein